MKRPAAVSGKAMGPRPKAARAAATTSETGSTGAKVVPVVKPKEVHREPTPWDAIVQALEQRGQLVPEVLVMISEALPDSLGVHKDQRHPFQERVLDSVFDELRKIEDGMLDVLRDLTAKVAHTDVERASLVESIAVAESEVHVKEEEHLRHKALLASLEEGVAAAISTLEIRRADQIQVIEAIDVAAERKTTLQSLMTQAYFPLKVGTLDNPVSKATDLVNALTALGFDASMLRSANSSLAKTPDARGSFDVCVIQHLEALLEQAGRNFEELESNGSARKVELQSGVDLASATLQATKDARDEGLIAESNSVVEATTARETLVSRSAALAVLDRFAAETGQSLASATEDVNTLRTEVLALFDRLRNSESREDVASTVATDTHGTQVAEIYESVPKAAVESQSEGPVIRGEELVLTVSSNKEDLIRETSSSLCLDGAMLGM